MKLLMNVLWATLGGGFLIAAQYFFGGLILCLTIVGIPFGKQCFKLAGLSLLPFGKEVHEDLNSNANGLLPLMMNLLWMVFGGFTTFISHVVLGFGLAISIIGIPFAIQHFKLAILSLFPFGRQVSHKA